MIFLVSIYVFFEITIIFALRLRVNAAKAEEEGVEGARSGGHSVGEQEVRIGRGLGGNP